MGSQLPPIKKGGTAPPPLFGPCLLWPNGWMDQEIPIGTEVGLGPGHIVLDGDPAAPRKGAEQPPPTFRPMSILIKRSPILATAELL